MTHYSKSQIFVQKFNFDKTPTFSRVFHPNFFRQFFFVKLKLSIAKKPKTITFSQVFQPKKLTIFSGNQSWISNSVLASSILVLLLFCMQKALLVLKWLICQSLSISFSMASMASMYYPISVAKLRACKARGVFDQNSHYSA